jgi:hypothetical protein
MKMPMTIQLSDRLTEEISAYLRQHDDMDLERLIERAVKREIAQPDPEALRAMVNLVGRFPAPRPVPLEDRQPEDRYTDRED